MTNSVNDKDFTYILQRPVVSETWDFKSKFPDIPACPLTFEIDTVNVADLVTSGVITMNTPTTSLTITGSDE